MSSIGSAAASRSACRCSPCTAGVALGLEDARQRQVLPLFRRGGAVAAFHGGYEQQLERLEAEAGVRQQL
jgi:hypothetical protein